MRDPASTPSEHNGRTVPLCQLRPGDRGRVLAQDLCCDDCELLRAMGMGEQSTLRVCRSGEPCIIEVGGTRLGISRAMARRIMVTVENGTVDS
ncbi:MAG: ferrous iron transport protein A [Planctomycetes bacterium]|nr:ferrous iron transport protein A [Planctomycetota bacterium]